jgi:hypothetical protein
MSDYNSKTLAITITRSDVIPLNSGYPGFVLSMIFSDPYLEYDKTYRIAGYDLIKIDNTGAEIISLSKLLARLRIMLSGIIRDDTITPVASYTKNSSNKITSATIRITYEAINYGSTKFRIVNVPDLLLSASIT